MEARRFILLASMFLPLLTLVTSPVPGSANQTITYTSLSTITEGTTTATITFIAFNTTESRTTEATTSIVKYVTTTTVFVEVRYGVTKAPHVVYETTTRTVPQTFTAIERHFVNTVTAEKTLTTYGSPLAQGEFDDNTHVFIVISAAIIMIVVLKLLATVGSVRSARREAS